MRLVLAISLCLWTPWCAEADTYYVNNALGSDLNSGMSAANLGRRFGPLRSIAAALRRVDPGDRILLANTGLPYRECITLQGKRHSGSELRTFELDGSGATLDGTAPVPADRWQPISKSIFRFHPDRLGHQQLFLGGELCQHMPTDEFGNLLSMVMRPGEWCGCDGAIQFAADKGQLPTDYDLSYAKHRVGITLYDVQRVVIRNLTIRGFQLDGVNAHDNAMDCLLTRVTGEANGRSGFSIGGASRVRLVECASRQNGVVPLRAEGWSTTELINTELLSGQGPSWLRQPNRRGQGARLIIDQQPQTELRGDARLSRENGRDVSSRLPSTLPISAAEPVLPVFRSNGHHPPPRTRGPAHE